MGVPSSKKGDQPAGGLVTPPRRSGVGAQQSQCIAPPNAVDVVAAITAVPARCNRSGRCCDDDGNVTRGTFLIALISPAHGDEARPELRLFLDACASSSGSEAPASFCSLTRGFASRLRNQGASSDPACVARSC